ncbi:hypothetical protein AVE84_21425 [Salmonella enterica subsp. enterica serovar Stanley]|nr:hypothetical protein [Salmonella enterica subsp. enterica serovar Stanley]
MTNMVTLRALKWSFAKFIFSTLMFFFTLPLILSFLNTGANPDKGYYSLITACLAIIVSSTYYGSEFIGRLILYKEQKKGE